MMRLHRNGMFGWLGWFVGSLAVFAAAPAVSHAGGTIKIDDTRSISIGAGLRTSFNAIEDQAPNGTSRSKDFALDSFRLYVSGRLPQSVSFEFNTDYDTTPTGTEDIRVLDGVLKFEFNDYFNVWAGRFLPPSDRSNLSGPYYLNSWDFPFVQAYPAVFAGRDDGVAIWGQVGKGQFKYQLGAFDGQTGGPNQSDSLLYAGRLVLNLWDPEPGYYNSSTYYGDKNVLAVGLTAMTQSDAVGTATTPGDFNGWSLDVLAERKLGGAGVGTLEGAYYDYSSDNGTLPAVTGADGNGYFILASYLLPQKLGVGQLQPVVRYQSFETDGANVARTRTDVGLNYIINGHNARISALFFNENDDSTSATKVDGTGFKLGLQFQI